LPNLKRLKFFEKDEINWTGKNELHDFYKTLLNLHTNKSALRAGDPESKTIRLKTSNDDHVFAYLRKNGNDEILVILNLSNIDVRFSIDEVSGRFKEVFSCVEKDVSMDKYFEMKGWEYLVFGK
jgi:glycosidase